MFVPFHNEKTNEKTNKKILYNTISRLNLVLDALFPKPAESIVKCPTWNSNKQNVIII